EPMNQFSIAFDRVQHHQNLIAHIPRINFFLPKGQFRADMAIVNSTVQSFVDQVLAIPPSELAVDDGDEDGEVKSKGSHKYSFLHSLAKFTRDPVVLRDQIIAVLLAGRDTTAGTLSFAMYELARSPACVARLRQEILSVVGHDTAPTYTDLNNMPYLHNIIRETLRMYPSVPYNQRTALVDTTLPVGGGRYGDKPLGIPKGTLLTYSPLLMHRHQMTIPVVDESVDSEKGARNIPRANLWSPERWESWHPKGHDYIPFNAGPRICVGQRFATIQMMYVLTRIFQKYARVENHMGSIDGGEVQLKADVTMKPGHGVFLALYEE
ncbi:hypothetical protein TD95_005358, partial [Thielaviopsis punctulata]